MALIVGAPYGGVKEQGPCVYANELAQRGFVVLTFDPCYMGESEGEPRHVSSPDLFTENFSAGVDFLAFSPLWTGRRSRSWGSAAAAALRWRQLRWIPVSGRWSLPVCMT